MSEFQVRGADGKTVVVPEGRWYMNAKGRTERMQRNSLSRGARQVYACLELGTMGFSRERAVMRKKGKDVPMTFAYIAEQTALPAPHVQDRYFPELETAGLAAKRPLNADLPLQKGNVELVSWAEPQKDLSLIIHPARGMNLPEWTPPSWSDTESPVGKLLRRRRITLSPDFHPTREQIEEIESAARDMEKAENAFLALLPSIPRAERPNKEERNERNIERNTPAVGRSETTTTEEPTDRPEDDLNQREKQVKEWMELSLPIPTALDTSLLRRIAATIETDEQLEHFKLSALAVKNPRKWIVFLHAWARDRDRKYPEKLKPVSVAGARNLAEEWAFTERVMEKFRNRGGKAHA